MPETIKVTESEVNLYIVEEFSLQKDPSHRLILVNRNKPCNKIFFASNEFKRLSKEMAANVAAIEVGGTLNKLNILDVVFDDISRKYLVTFDAM